jgi:DNA-binding NarL/FixJ family response regulator
MLSVDRTMRPLIVIEGSLHVSSSLLRTIEAAGWDLHAGFRLESREWSVAGITCHGGVSTTTDASLAILAAARGAGVVAAVLSKDEVLERLIEDLSRIGPIDRWPRDASEPLSVLTLEQTCLIELLALGKTLTRAARILHISRRTADRQIAEARTALGATTTAEAVVKMAESGRLNLRNGH